MVSKPSVVPSPKSSTRAAGPGRPKDMGKRAAILEAAKQLFTELGFGGVSMDGIAARAGVSKLTVYSHYGDKETLFAEAVRAQCQALLPDDLFGHARKGPLRAQLVEIGLAFFAMIGSDAAMATHRMMLAPGTGDEHVREMFWNAGPKRTQQDLAQLLQAHVAAGELEIPDLPLAASQFFCLVKGELHSLMMCGLCRDPSQARIQAHVQASVDFFLRAYAPR
ncbi:TetR/AcrR family transcriptional regulator [Xanthomonas sp. NCPPB 2654]|jgi:TetR/AcrR family transcriptional regulator, mexJK operon transcriptional repressor|uniref:TetR/AcrR family transcriptional regulator n=1 Tax=unclassified Xanthomonas TaxID=2643310 RepID=UPI0021E03F69|nr:MULTISPECIES: TetR/AcrR family transcriptional regulator [unclassified Xanthomonas]MDL5365701.1 TetR/AcrR family transcriptional regulator [Xanthomonas sp. NCPPB 2654]MDR6672460.1 AcrR family transcriptional regulator [Xanthomonas translucens]MEB1528476.1 TetR/AcrR family transcriptional regulator [Xanthomonas campestris pv. campestris]UYC19911.1 TetR/AcrR family transcriptional regulator [Xanthomonas sp. CFBP 8443]